MSIRLHQEEVDLAKKSLALKGSHTITSADGVVTGDFDSLQALTSDASLTSISYKNNCTGANRLSALPALPLAPILVGFTSIQLSGGTVQIYGTRN